MLELSNNVIKVHVTDACKYENINIVNEWRKNLKREREKQKQSKKINRNSISEKYSIWTIIGTIYKKAT